MESKNRATAMYSNLNESQYKAVFSNSKRLLTLAGAGTGKTRVLTHRIARLYEDGVSPGEMLALTFTRAAGAEMKERIIKLIGEDGRDLFCNTFHAWAVSIIRSHAHALGLKPDFTIYDEEDQTAIIQRIIDDLQYKAKVKDVLDAMDKNTLYRVPIPEGELSQIVNEYRFQCRKNNAIDLDGLLLSLGYLLKDEAMREKMRERWPYIFVDEFQDTDHRQMDILDAINPKNLFVVGDDFQSIYGFRGADVTIIMGMAEDPAYQVVKLEENYRSTAPIVDAANALIKHNHQTEKILRNDRKGPEIKIYESESPECEMDDIVHLVTAIPETAYKDIAILGRTNKQIQAAAEALGAAGIPHVIRTKSADAMESQDAKKLFTWMAAILNPQDDATIESVINWPEQTIRPREKQTAEMFALENDCPLMTALQATNTAVGFLNIYSTIQREIAEDYDEHEQVSALDLFEYVLEATRIKGDYHAKGLTNRIQLIDEILTAIQSWCFHQIEIGEPYTAEAWLERYRMRMLEADQQTENHEDAVQIMTAHGSKGLEFEAVIIIGCNNKSFPLGKGEIEEERRLFYVALTRAKRYLYLTRSKMRTTWGNDLQPSEESIFIQEMT